MILKWKNSGSSKLKSLLQSGSRCFINQFRLDRLQTLNESVSRQYFIGAVPISKTTIWRISSTLEISLNILQDKIQAKKFERTVYF